MANSDKRFIYENDDGSISIVYPADNTDLTLDEIKAKDCPSGKTVYTVDKSAIPTDRSFRNAWTYTEQIMGFGIDMAKAREIHKTNIRNARTSKLAELDVEFTQALEVGTSTTDIAAKRQALRDAPADSGIAAASDTDALKAQWKTDILGTSP